MLAMSSSSNVFESDQLQYEDGFANEMQSPWYPTFGQPLLYYSQIQPFRNWQRFREPEKDKSNCFKKAFRWYTQERALFKNGNRDSSSNMNKAHLKGFAAWLDEKYNEFLEAGQIEGTKYILTQTSTIEMGKSALSERSEKTPKKRYKRVKSAWKKHTKYLNAKEKGDVIMKSRHSIEMILKPKELSRTGSECCQRNNLRTSKNSRSPLTAVPVERTKVHACCKRSNSNDQCNATTMHGITKPRPQSLTSFVIEKEVHAIPFDVPDYDVTNEGVTLQKSKNGTYPSLINLKNKFGSRRQRHRPRNVSCQCSRYMLEGIDAYSQFEDPETKTRDSCHCKYNKEEIIPPFEYHKNEKKEKLVEPDTARTLAQSKTAPECAFQKDEATITRQIEKNRSPIYVPLDENVQTSDHSINLNEYLCPKHYKYPLFMKIVRADKLKEN